MFSNDFLIELTFHSFTLFPIILDFYNYIETNTSYYYLFEYLFINYYSLGVLEWLI